MNVYSTKNKDNKLKNIYLTNRNSLILNKTDIINEQNYNKKIKVFLETYKLNKTLKEKRYEIDKSNNFLFEIHNFQYIDKLKEACKSIFSNDFYKKLFSNEINQVIFCINKLHKIIEKNNNKNDVIMKIIENFDILLKILGFILYSNQSSSLIKYFFEFIECYINYCQKEIKKLNDIESNILLNIFCDKLINPNNVLSNHANNLILKLSDIIGVDKIFLMLTNIIKYKNNKLKNKIITIILNIFDKINLADNILLKNVRNILILYFESELNIKNKIILLLKKTYEKIGEKDFYEFIQFLSNKQKEEILLKIYEKEIKNNDIKEKIFNKNGNTFKRYANSEEKRIKNISKLKKNGNNTPEKILNNRNYMKINKAIYKNGKTFNNYYSNTSNIKHHTKNNTSILRNKIHKNIIPNKSNQVTLTNSSFHRNIKRNINSNKIKTDKLKPKKNNNNIKKFKWNF